ncbi:exodeoxyribonuclease V subunit beta [Nakamurella silvestris]|nr:exodeoxyribonuclease V subunit beta [Nakamurella silvestris]
MISHDPVPAFDIGGPLPTGTSVLEASAGTGKTYTVGALVARYIAEGLADLDQLLVVTFGRAASQELRERVRFQLVAAEAALRDPSAAAGSADPLIAALAAAEPEVRRRRLARALADFDAATIVTTHQFCQQVLVGLGTAGDSDPATVLVDDLDDLVVEVVDDLYLRGFALPHAPEPVFSRATALQLARAAVADGQAELAPGDVDRAEPAARRVNFAQAVRREVEERKRRRGVLGYEDLLTRLAGVLRGSGGPDPVDGAAGDRMRHRWRVVLVDEFQDTDPVQWEVLRLAFGGYRTLVLIGDPKQAIYAFRGGDVVTYLGAVRSAGSHTTLSRNHRTDGDLLDGLRALIGGAALGDPDILVRPVSARYHGRRLPGAPVADPVRLRVARRDQFRVPPAKLIRMDTIRQHVTADLSADVLALLGSGSSFDGRPLVPADVAVLVSTHQQALMVRDGLAGVGVPAVIAGGISVYATSAAADWLTLLKAMERPDRAGTVRAAALGVFLGRPVADLLAEGRAGEELTAYLSSRIARLAEVFDRRGAGAVLGVCLAEEALGERLLREPDGERRLTDLRHLSQDLQSAAADGLGTTALIGWLITRIEAAGSDGSTDRIRRLDSDAAAVQVVTLHAAKGMEYPVVYLPFAFDHWVRPVEIPLLHNDSGRRILDVGGDGTEGRPLRERRAQAELAGESLRLLYVGLTRAQSQVVMWWAPSSNTPAAALHRVLFGRRPDSAEIPDSTVVPTDELAARRLAELQSVGGPVVEPSVPGTVGRLDRAHTVTTELAVGIFDRELDTDWRRSSFSSLTASAEHHGVESEPEETAIDDEVLAPGTDGSAEHAELREMISPMAGLPSGTDFGTLVHAVLELVDPMSADLPGELQLRCEDLLRRYPLPVTPEILAGAVELVIRSPLGAVGANLCLADIPLTDRLAEMEFELPLTGGDRPVGTLTLGDLAPLLRRHLSSDDPLAGYADRLAGPALAGQPLRGYLTGSLDVVLRLPGPRYVVADYKTNWLADPDEPDLTMWHYRPEACARAMAASDYPLQALLYSVTLHRYLRWRQPGYRPEVHLGGVLYLFVRGMAGPATAVVDGRPCGVFGWVPPAALICEISDLLDRGIG